jgi:hypothetical protein
VLLAYKSVKLIIFRKRARRFRVIFGNGKKTEGTRPLRRPRRRWGIILRWIFRKWEGVVGTGWSGLRIGTVGGHL